MIITDDLNRKRQECHCFDSNKSGNLLLDFCLKNNIIIANPQNSTNFPTIGRPSVIDFFLLKSEISYVIPIAKTHQSSDHNRVEITVEFNHKIIHNVIYDYIEADWTKFRKELNDSLNLNFTIHLAEDLERQMSLLIDQINVTLINNVPTKKANFFKKKSRNF